MKIVTSEQMRQIEHSCAGIGLPAPVLMENAGRAVAEQVRLILGKVEQANILLLIGPGNNGGDGLVAARHLHDQGAAVSVYLFSDRAGDANLGLVRQRGIDCVPASQDEGLARLDRMLAPAGCVIDALFGTGKVRPLQGAIREALGRVSARKQKSALQIIAVDLPSGLDADSGAVDPACLKADHTITLGLPKPGLFLFPGAARVGRLSIADIGIPGHLTESITTEMITAGWARDTLPERPMDANKGTFGRVLVVAGSTNYTGAACLACNGAMRAGAGLVTLAAAASLHPIMAAKLTEITHLPLPESSPGTIAAEAAPLLEPLYQRYNVLMAGCGLGQSRSVSQFIADALLRPGPPAMVLDADALNALAAVPEWWRQMPAGAVLTPHPGEMARLCQCSVEDVLRDRIGTAIRMAQRWGQAVALKGAYTIIAAPDGRCRVNPLANPGLASAGTGDVLCGVIAGLMAQGLAPFDAAALGAYLHGLAGEAVSVRLGDAGIVASDLLPELPGVMKRLKDTNKPMSNNGPVVR